MAAVLHGNVPRPCRNHQSVVVINKNYTVPFTTDQQGNACVVLATGQITPTAPGWAAYGYTFTGGVLTAGPTVAVGLPAYTTMAKNFSRFKITNVSISYKPIDAPNYRSGIVALNTFEGTDSAGAVNLFSNIPTSVNADAPSHRVFTHSKTKTYHVPVVDKARSEAFNAMNEASYLRTGGWPVVQIIASGCLGSITVAHIVVNMTIEFTVESANDISSIFPTQLARPDAQLMDALDRFEHNLVADNHLLLDAEDYESYYGAMLDRFFSRYVG